MAAAELWTRQLEIGSFPVTPRQVVLGSVMLAVVLANAKGCTCSAPDLEPKPRMGPLKDKYWSSAPVELAVSSQIEQIGEPAVEGPTALPHYFAPDVAELSLVGLPPIPTTGE